MKSSNRFSPKSRIKSFQYAFKGIFHLIKNEHNARIHVVALIAVIIAGIFLKINKIEWLIITIVAGLVPLTELINTAVERLADLVEPNHDHKIGMIKDYCAGAVLISATISFIVGLVIFVPRILKMI